MKKSLFIILMVCLAIVGLVSCKNEIEPAQEELVSVSFENGTSRALIATLETFDVSKYYWAYEAKKSDGSGLKSGETTWDTTGAGSVPVSAGNKGLGTGTDTAYEAYKVPNFSKGYWNFRLFAYTACSGSGTDTDPYIYSGLVYWGEVDSVLIDNSHHEAKVTVSPVSGDKGYLKIGTIALIPAEGGQPTDLVVYTDKVYVLGQTTPVAVEPVDGVYTLDAGQYQFTRTYSFAGIPVAEGSVIVTIYSGLTTTVSGTLSELTTYTEFGAEQNPDIIIKSVSASGINSETTGDTYGNVNLVDSSIAPENQKVKATIPATAAVKLLPEDPANPGQRDPNASMSLALNVDTTASTSTSVTYDISMTKTVTIDSESTTSPVASVSEWVIVEIVLRSGLNDVAVSHSTVPMVKTTSLDELKGNTDVKGAFFYDSDAGKLYIKTKSFSPFQVTYKLTDAVAAVISKDKYKEYSSLADAIGAVQDGEGIILLADTETGSSYDIYHPLVLNKKDVVFDLNGKKLTVTGNFSLLISGNNDVVKNGTIQAGANSAKVTKINSYAIVINGCDGAILEDLVINGGVSFGGSTGETPSPAAATNAVIKDCVVTSGDFYAVCAQQNSTVTIESGNYTADSRSAYSGTIQGTFKGGDGPKGTVTVTGGVFNGPIVNNDKGDLVLKGGLYSVKPADEYLAEGYITIKTSNNKWEVVKFLPGTGTEADPYVIADIDAWMLLVRSCEYDSTYSVTDGKYFKMTSSIDVSSKTVRATVHYFAGHIDFTNKVLSGFNSSNMVAADISDDGLVAVFSKVKGNVSFKNVTFNIAAVTYNNMTTLTMLAGRLYADTSVLFENITTDGIATGVTGNNNGPLCTYGAWVSGVNITCKNCTNNATIVGSGYRSAFIGSACYFYGATLSFENCVNNGFILTTGPAAMLISNGNNTYASAGTIAITVKNCINNGRIIGSGAGDGALLINHLDGGGNVFTVNEKTWAEYKADTTIGGNLLGNPGETIATSVIDVTDGCFVLTKTDDAAYYQLQFAFSASSHAGGNVGYLIEFGNSTTPFDTTKDLPSDIKVSSWVDDETKVGEVTSYQPTNSTAGTLYLDASEHYVFNEQGSRLRDKVFVTFIAYGSNNEILSIKTYQY